MDDRSRFQTYLQYALVRTLTAALGALPRSFSAALGRCVGRAAYFGFGRLRHIGLRNLRIAFPKISKADRRKILRACFDNLGRQLGEFCHFERATVEKLRKVLEYDPESLARFNEAKSRGKGILLVTGHLGAWELLPFAHSAFGNPLHILVRTIENPLIERLIHSIRARFGNQTIDKRNSGLTCLRVLKKGGMLGILSDLNSLPQEGVFVPFFGELACTTLAVAALALQTDAVVFPVFAPWETSRKRYVFRGGPAIDLVRTGDHDKDLAINTARVASVMEKWIRAYPEQWLWIHDRWHALVRPGDRICTEFPPVG